MAGVSLSAATEKGENREVPERKMEEPEFLKDLALRRGIFETRAAFLDHIRRFFKRRRFLEVDAPLLVPAAGMEPHLDPFEVRGAVTGMAAYLPTSPEFYLKKLVASGVRRCFCLAPSFRDEAPSKGHHPEFLMLEWYRAGVGRRALLKDCADLLKDLGARFLPGGLLEKESVRCDFTSGMEVLSLSELFRRFAGGDWLELEDEDMWRTAARENGAEGCESWSRNDCFSFLMVAAVEPALAHFKKPLAVVGYPAFQAALARLDPEDARISDRFELFAAGVEIANAYTELTDADEQRRRFLIYQEERRAHGKTEHPEDVQFMEAVGHLPPCAGIALGADRLLALLLGETVARVRHGCKEADSL